MATKLLDISFWQDTLDFAKIKKSGYDNIILRAGYGTTIDSKFNEYANACKKNNINIVAVYWFIYATNLTEVKANANKCLEVIKAYKPKIVFVDFEYDTVNKAAKKGIKLGAKECDSFTIEFCETVKKAGYIPGYYANTDYYKNMYSSVKNKGYVFWLAHYKSDYSYHEPPIKCDFFQYTDRGTVPGLTGKKFDTNVCFSEKYLSKSSTTSTDSPKPTTTQGSDNMTTEKAIDALIATAQAEIGYMEKKSNAQLDDKNTNVGDGNYTKYWRDLKPSWNGSAWCAVWVSWCMYKTFGLETAKKLLKHENDFPYVYCPTLGARFTKYANPQRGDIVIFYRNGTFAHTGIVTKVEGDKFYTIEGNTNNGSTIIANGGSVCSKSYNNSNLPGTKFCRPDYSIVKSIMNSSSTSKPSTTTYKKWVGAATKNGTDVFANSTGTSKLSTYPKLNKGNLVDVIGVSGTRYQVKIADKFVGYVEKSNIKDPNAVVTKPSASTSKPAKKGYNKSEKWKGVIAAKSGLKVRKSPGTSNADFECSFSPLKYNTPVSVCDSTTGSDGNKWYYICYKGKYGFSSAKYIKKK